jgi:hypothetical protein
VGTGSTERAGDQQRLEETIRGRHTCISITTYEEEYALELVRNAALQQGVNLWIWSFTSGVREGLLSGGAPVRDTEHPAAAMWHLTYQKQERSICALLDVTAHLEDNKTLRLLRDMIREFDRRDSCLILIDHRDDLPPVIKSEATPLELSLPDETELDDIIRDTLRSIHRERAIEVDISRRGLETVIRNLRGLTRRQAEQIIAETVIDDRRFDEQDINHVLARKRQQLQQGGLLQYIEAPVNLDEIGGLRRLKTWLEQRQGAHSKEAMAFGIGAPRGVLMLGVQGAGKSLCAKAIATAWSRPLLRMDVGALYDRYVGESEKRLRDAFRQAEMMAPIILWIDEIEKAFASAASRSTDGGLSQRMFGSLLTWMQEHTSPVFLVATANDIEALPPELLRKGRFDEIFFVDLPDKKVRQLIFSIHLKKRNRNPDNFDLERLATESDGFSGAEIEQAVLAALHEAFGSKAELTTELLVKILHQSPPLSVTMAEKVESLRRWAADRCLPAD